MIRQLTRPTIFADASSVVIELPAPSVVRTIVVVAVRREPANAAVRLSDGAAGSARAWRCASDGPTAYWFRMGPPGLTAIHVATSSGHISGTTLAAEVAGLSPGDAVQALADLLAEAA